MRTSSRDDSLHCSFCKKAEKDVGKLISSPDDYPRCYICDECIAVCAAMIQDHQAESQQPDELPADIPPHPLLNHPFASGLMQAIEVWAREESLGNDGLLALRRVRDIAGHMLNEPLYTETAWKTIH